ncbi:MAG: tyrosine-type recombinase/integrase [Nitrospira sp.]|nr:tyrosine-type recombinase/integrase [Nitrospira sp.]
MESYAHTPPDDLPSFLERIRTHYPSVYLALKLALASGLRRGEVLRLNGQSVDVQAWTMRLPSRKSTTMPTRDVTVSPALASELRRYRSAKRRARRLR